MRIGFYVAQTCLPKSGRGWVANLLAKALAEIAPEHHLDLYHHSEFFLNADTSAGTAAARNVGEPFRGLSPAAARGIWAAVAAGAQELPGNPDIVHTNCFETPPVGSAKLVYTIHDVSFWIHPEFTSEENRLIWQQGVLEAIGRAAAFVFISQSLLDEFECIFPGLMEKKRVRHKVVLLASRFEPVAQPHSKLPNGDWLAVGSLEPRKNYETILAAFQKYFDQSTIKRRLTIAGGRGWKSDNVRARINKLEHQGLVKYEGYVEDARLQELYSNAFGLIFLSHYEGFGLPIVEAMSQACPVITRRNSSLPEVGGSAAIYCDNDAAEIANAMLRLERDGPYYLATSHASWTHAKRFSWSTAAEKVLDLYRQLVTK